MIVFVSELLFDFISEMHMGIECWFLSCFGFFLTGALTINGAFVHGSRADNLESIVFDRMFDDF